MGGATSVSRAAALALLVLIPMAGARSLLVRGGVPQLTARFARGCSGLAGDTSMLQSLCERLSIR